MSILLDRSNRVLIQGVTGQMGTFFVEDARKYGTNMVAGVSPGRAGTTVGNVPVFASVKAAREATGADTAMVFVPPAAVLGAVMEAIEGGCRLVGRRLDRSARERVCRSAIQRHALIPARGHIEQQHGSEEHPQAEMKTAERFQTGFKPLGCCFTLPSRE